MKALQKIGKLSLHNSAPVIAKIQFSYQQGGGTAHLSKKSHDILVTQTKTVDPGALGVPDGATIKLKVDIELLKDKEASQTFIYKKDNSITANYKLIEKVFKLELEYENVAGLAWNNWSKNIVYNAPGNTQSYFYPKNQDDLKKIVLQAAEAGVNVRVSGQRHSQPPLVTHDNRSVKASSPTSWLLDMSCYADLGNNGDKRMEMDKSGTHVTVNTGVSEDELDVFLTKHNKMLITVTAGGFFSIGGMTAVDVHGATIGAPIFAETASAFHIMDAKGDIMVINDTMPAEDGWKPIQFARVSLGALGVVTRVTIKVQERHYATTLKPGKAIFHLKDEQTFVDKFAVLCATHSRIETFYNPYSSKFLALWWDIDNDPATKTSNQAEDFPTTCELAEKEEYGAPYEGKIEEPIAEYLAIKLQESGSPLLASLMMDTALSTIEGLFKKAEQAYSDLWLTAAARVMFMSYFVELPTLDETGLKQAWKGLNAVAERLRNNHDFLIVGPMEFRFIKGGDTALASTYTKKANSNFINLDLIGFVEATEDSQYPDKLLEFFADIEREWVALGGFPHNGKMYGFYDPAGASGTHTAPFNAGFIKNLVERKKDRVLAFEAYRKQVDSEGRFGNAYVKKLLGVD